MIKNITPSGMRHSLAFLLLLLVLGCARESSRLPQNAPYENFSVRCGTDTTVVLKNGFTVHFMAGSLDCNGREVVDVRLHYLLRTADIVLAGMHTRDAQGRLMESGGMFRLEFPAGHNIRSDSPVTVSVPAAFTDAGMALYDLADLREGWRPLDARVEAPDQDIIGQGKALFKTHCAACHCEYLREDLTGPALGNIHLYRDSAWLIRYTRDAMKLVEAGEPLAACLWERWKPTLMPAFDTLTDAQLAAVYRFIRNESARLDIGPEEVFFPPDCKRQSVAAAAADTTRRGTVVAGTKSTAYEVEVTDDVWINIDKLLNLETRIDPLLVHVEPQRGVETSVSVALPHRKVVASLYELRPGLYALAGENERVPFFVDEPVVITAARYDAQSNRLLAFETADYVTRDKNNEVHLNNYKAGDAEAFLAAFESQRANIARKGPTCLGHMGQH